MAVSKSVSELTNELIIGSMCGKWQTDAKTGRSRFQLTLLAIPLIDHADHAVLHFRGALAPQASVLHKSTNCQSQTDPVLLIYLIIYLLVNPTRNPTAQFECPICTSPQERSRTLQFTCCPIFVCFSLLLFPPFLPPSFFWRRWESYRALTFACLLYCLSQVKPHLKHSVHAHCFSQTFTDPFGFPFILALVI